MATGKLKMWDADRGFGFIKQDDGSIDIFMHVTSLLSSGIDPDNLAKGDSLTTSATVDSPPRMLDEANRWKAILFGLRWPHALRKPLERAAARQGNSRSLG